MSNKPTDLVIQREYGDKEQATFCIDGLSVTEMSMVLSNNSSLASIMDKHGAYNIYREWAGDDPSKNNGDICGIRHVGGHLFVTVSLRRKHEVFS